MLTVLVAIGGMYGIARWYIHQEGDRPATYGVSFIPDYASYLGLDPQKTMDALISDLHVRQFRLTSYWSDIETSPGQYDFSTLDWEFTKADAAHAKVNLTVGLRQPRWPECHAPTFYDTSQPESTWYPQLKAFMTAVVNRYKGNPALAGYQIENEYFLQGFGTCTNRDRQRLVDETALVRRLDPRQTIIIGRSNNALGWPIGAPQPDEFSISVYRRVWDANVSHRYLEYPFPAWFYAFTAGWQKIMTGHDMIIGELQAEAWPPNKQTIPDTSLNEQSKSIDAQRLKTTIQFGRATGMKTIDLWGAEYWYYRKTVLHDPSLWDTARPAFTTH
ncbi:MAG TPA: beta-galactosidase [Candidatus Saccharimonadales bacterium]|nr:beta-galactosidase [Candidatus Saccharimonadales bacterium]